MGVRPKRLIRRLKDAERHRQSSAWKMGLVMKSNICSRASESMTFLLCGLEDQRERLTPHQRFDQAKGSRVATDDAVRAAWRADDAPVDAAMQTPGTNDTLVALATCRRGRGRWNGSVEIAWNQARRSTNSHGA